MIAHHPLTGQPIHILRTQTQLAYDQKTIVWLRSDHDTSHRWKRWIPVVSEIEAVDRCGPSALGATILGKDANIDEWFPVLQTIYEINKECLFFVTEHNYSELCERGFQTDRVLIWEELHEAYPFLSAQLTEQSSIESVILSIAYILRIQRIAWTVESLGETETAHYLAWKQAVHGSIVHIGKDDSCIPKLYFIQQYFHHTSQRRQKELVHCLQQNINNDMVDFIILINEQEYPELPTSSKITVLSTAHRLTYKEVFKTIQERVPSGAYAMFANADIYCTESLRALWSLDLVAAKVCLALLRWDEDAAHFQVRSDNQDSWIVARDSVTDLQLDEFDFPFGKAGCDNAFALLMMRARFLVANPAHTIRTIHVHSSNVRNYDPKDLLYRSHYLYLEPTAIQNYSVVKDLKPYEVRLPFVSNASFTRVVRTVDDSLKTVGDFHVNETNLFTANQTTGNVYHISGGIFCSWDGLVSDHRRIFVGQNSQWLYAWESTQHTSLMPAIHVPHLVVLPLQGALSLDQWVLHYLPRVLVIQEYAQKQGLPVPEFLVPNVNDIGALLSDFQWDTKTTVIPMVQTSVYWSEDVWCCEPVSEPIPVSAEDISRLRALLPPSTSVVRTPTVVFCVSDNDSDLCNRKWADDVATYIVPKWKIHVISGTERPSVRRKAFQEASWILGSGPALQWMWLARPGTTVLEFANGSNCVHLAGACSIRYIAGTVKPDSIENQRQHAMIYVGRSIQILGFHETLKTIRDSKTARTPTIIVPTGFTGYLSHNGDQFREMVDIWHERKYIQIEKSTSSPYCWWGGVGEVLLYDRPTLRWWMEDTSYQYALFGNSCTIPGSEERQSLWGFWGTSPSLLETIDRRALNLRSYNDRTIKSLFSGRIRNGLHKVRRSGADWSSAVESFSLIPTDSPYERTMTHYLEMLCNTQFGLCLPGSGLLCGRDIEYLACGVVPIFTPGMKPPTLLVPLVEGVHFLRAKDAADVARIVRETTVAEWTKLSAAGRTWWSTYASAEGLFRLTWARIEQCRPYAGIGLPKRFL